MSTEFVTVTQHSEELDKGFKELKSLIEDSNKESQNKIQKETLDKIKELTEDLDAKSKATQEHCNKIDAKLQKFTKDGSNKSLTKQGFISEFQKAIKTDGKDFITAYKDSKRYHEIEIKGVSGRDLFLVNKAVGTMTTADSIGAGVIEPQRIPSVLEIARYMNHARALFNQYPTSSPTVEQAKEVVGEGAVAPQTEGSAKSQIDRDFSLVSTPVETLAGFIRISTQLLEDMPLLNSYLPELLRREMAELEDAQFMYGNGTSPNISGIADSGNYTAFTAFDVDANAQIMDLLMAVITQIEVAKHDANGILLHPYQWLQLFNLKDSTNNYMRGLSFDQTTNQLSLMGVPVIKAQYVTAGEYFVGDFVRGAEIYDRTGFNVRFFEQDSDNVTKNLVTVRGEERSGLFVKYPASFVYGTASTDIAKIVNFT